jgi:hypothetical protein
MTKVWKWILGIVLGLIVVSVLVGIGFALVGGFHAARVGLTYSRGWNEQGPGMMPFGYGLHMRGPGIVSRVGFFPFGGIIGGIVFLAFLALVILGIIWLAKYLRSPKAAVQTPASTQASASVEMSTCKNCGKPIQTDWRNCPYCGKKV